MAIDPNKVIYSMIGVSKFYDKKPVLKDIYLSYFYGAKIGVLGLNGSGKSSLLRILAGVDQDFLGKTILSPGYTVGFLHQDSPRHRRARGPGDRRSDERVQCHQREVRRADVRR
jgi:sulfate-transporting ATPase